MLDPPFTRLHTAHQVVSMDGGVEQGRARSYAGEERHVESVDWPGARGRKPYRIRSASSPRTESSSWSRGGARRPGEAGMQGGGGREVRGASAVRRTTGGWRSEEAVAGFVDGDSSGVGKGGARPHG
jgi:hypothetical protein